jgi:hypothetical protein
MAKPKSFLARLAVDHALRAHPCQHNKKHRLQKGDVRLKMTVDRADEHFCGPCALESISLDIRELEDLRQQLLESQSKV